MSSNMEQSNSEGSYRYNVLPSPRHIRLLILKPSLLALGVSCDLVFMSLDDEQRYEALSYVWGDAQQKRSIRCSGKLVEVGVNLEVAMRHLRHHLDTRVLWVDALCINQDDIAERNAQVRMMGEIYSKASTTLIWLGEEADESARVLSLTEKFQAIHKQPDLSRLILERGSTDETFRLLQTLKFSTSDLLSLKNFYARPWFSRKWIIQELVLSKDPIVVLGSCQLPWFALENFTSILVHYKLHLNMFVDPATQSIAHMANIFMLGSFRVNNPGLFGALLGTISFQCFDPRDHLISLLGFTGTPAEDIKSLVDYSRAPNDLFRKFMSIGIQRTEGLRLFALVNLIPLKDRAQSWVPCLSALGSAAAKSITMTNSLQFFASPVDAISSHFSDDEFCLSLFGRFVDIIDQLSPRPGPSYYSMSFSVGKEHFDWFAETALMATAKSVQEIEDSITSDTTIKFMRAFLMDAQYKLTIDEFRKYLDYLKWLPFIFNDLETGGNQENIRSELPDILTKFEKDIEFTSSIANRYFGRTIGGDFGWMPLYTEPGDVICVFNGAKAAHVLRPCMNGKYKLIGGLLSSRGYARRGRLYEWTGNIYNCSGIINNLCF